MRMRRWALAVFASLAICTGCGKSGLGCSGASKEAEPDPRPMSREKLRELLGEARPGKDGRWGRLRTTQSESEQYVQTQIRQLEALGYASGTKTAPSLAGVVRHDASRAYPGLNFYTAGHASEAVLMGLDGRVAHRWAKDFWEVWPNDGADREQEGTQHWRRAHLFPNGDLLVIHEGLGLVKLDKDSNVIWAKRNGAHHDLQVLPNGDIAVLARVARVIERVDYRRPTLEDFVLILDANGEEGERYSLLEAFERSEAHGHIWDEGTRRWGDLFHTNSIEVLDGRFASKNPAFAKGNFLLSSRHLDTVFIVDPDGNEVIWALRGAFKAQHDAKMLDDGSLMLFDNSGRRRISAVQVYDIANGELQWEYAGSEAQPFYTQFCGASQRLPNGNTLITESDNGRAFEITEDGTIVWDFYNPHRAGENDEFIATLFMVERVPVKYVGWLESE